MKPRRWRSSAAAASTLSSPTSAWSRWDGLTLFKRIHADHPSLPVILLTAYASIENAIEIMKGGAFDYITKPFKVDDMLSCLKRAETKILRDVSSATSLDTSVPLTCQLDNLIATSPAMLAVCETIRKVAPTTSTVLLNGESGTGKEVVAKAIHRCSARARAEMVAVNCAAMPEQLMLQGKLLRALQEGGHPPYRRHARLREQLGFAVARRTVAKYRRRLGVPSACRRKMR